MAKKKKADDSEKLSDSEVLFPAGEPYTLSGGKVVFIMPWSIETIGLVAQRLPALIERVQTMDPDGDAIKNVMPQALDEIEWLIHRSVPDLADVPIATGLPADDVLGLSLAVYDQCMAGPLRKIAALAGRARGLMAMAGVTTPSE